MTENYYTSLHTHSHYSILDSLIRIDDLFNVARENGMAGVALTDHGNVFGHYDFWATSRKEENKSIKPIFGCEVYMEKEHKGKLHHLILLAKTNHGLSNLYNILRLSNENFYRYPRANIDILKAYSSDLVCSTACLGGYTAVPLLNGEAEEGINRIIELREIFKDDFYLEIQDENVKEFDVDSMSYEEIFDLRKLSIADRENIGCEFPKQLLIKKKYREISQELSIPIIATSDPHYLSKEDGFVHDVLLCIRSHSSVKDDVKSKENPKGKRFAFSNNNFFFKPLSYMLSRFRKEEVFITNTIADSCNVTIAKKRRFPKYVPENYDMESYDAKKYMKELLNEGWRKKGINEKENKKEYEEKIRHEFEVLSDADLLDYFLILSDITTWCDENDISYGPRGSAASCLLSYILGITNVDPVKHKLIFERFFNKARIEGDAASGLDIDIDFEKYRRPEVIEYIKKRFGENKVCPIITFESFDTKSALKAVGRSLAVPYEVVNNITKNMFPKQYKGIDDAIKKSKDLQTVSKKYKRLFDIAKKLEGLIYAKGRHACGVILSDEPFEAGTIPLSLDTKKRQLLAGFDGKTMDKLGYMKADILGLKALSVIKETIRLINDREKE